MMRVCKYCGELFNQENGVDRKVCNACKSKYRTLANNFRRKKK